MLEIRAANPNRSEVLPGFSKTRAVRAAAIIAVRILDWIIFPPAHITAEECAGRFIR